MCQMSSFPLLRRRRHTETQRRVPGKDAKAAAGCQADFRDPEATQTPVNSVYMCGRRNLLWLNGCWNIDKAPPRRRIQCHLTKGGLGGNKAQHKSYLVGQVAHMASGNEGCLRTRHQWQGKTARRATPPATLSPVLQMKKARWEKTSTWKRKTFTSVDVSIQTIPRRFVQLHVFFAPQNVFWRNFLSMNSVKVVRVLRFPCVCVCVWMSHPGVTPPYVGGWFGGLGVFGLCKAAGPS